MTPQYSNDYLDRVYEGVSVFDLWSLLTAFERQVTLPERSWLFCRLVEWVSSTRSSVWTYYEATGLDVQTRISTAVGRCPELRALAEYFNLGMRTWKSTEEVGPVDAWIDSHEAQIHASLMQLAREDKLAIIKLNGEQDGAANQSQPVRPEANRPSPAAGSGG